MVSLSVPVRPCAPLPAEPCWAGGGGGSRLLARPRRAHCFLQGLCGSGLEEDLGRAFQLLL